ncbi:hypothetical protein MKW92_049066 [Papaver armeniacum]|nr:hypothetical protein MKW92_031377 [Papaver armeniacum]KAI3927088.1 hypothetical protein MKW92_049066 [Papaver armeniacum]
MQAVNIVFLIFGVVIATHIHDVVAQGVFNVLDSGAKGDGKTDDTQAFIKAWDATCKEPTGIPKMVIPKGRSFLVMPTTFPGPCKAKNISVELAGTILAPESPKAWAGKDSGGWIIFANIAGLKVYGGGVIDGRGKAWWEQSCHNPKGLNHAGCSKRQPTAIHFIKTDGGQFRDITVQNGQMFHVALMGLDGFEAYNIKINAPIEAPNTDGIHTMNVKNVVIADSQFRSGDDCVSIGQGSSFVYVRNCHCGPGHGVSIGSLGSGGENVAVEEIHVEKIQFVGTMFGCRIKTYPGGKGYCRKVTYKNSNFTNVLNPIFIDQYYFTPETVNEGSAVKISDVTFEGLTGTADTTVTSAITMKCSKMLGCDGIKFNKINITPVKPGVKLVSTVKNARGAVLGAVEPALPDLVKSA